MPLFGGSNKGKQECRVVMLDNSEVRHQITNKTYGHELLWKILSSLELYEKEYFGLRYKDRSGFSHWIVLHKTIRKQIVNYDPTFYFGVKFYAADPTKLREEVTRYQFFLQVKRDILQVCFYLHLHDCYSFVDQSVCLLLGQFIEVLPHKRGCRHQVPLQDYLMQTNPSFWLSQKQDLKF